MLVCLTTARAETDRVLRIAASPRFDAKIANRQLLACLVVGKGLRDSVVAVPYLNPHLPHELVIGNVEAFAADIRVALNDHPVGGSRSSGRRRPGAADVI